MDAKNPVIPWSELEGQFFKVDVGSTNGDAYFSDILTKKTCRALHDRGRHRV